MTDSSGNFIYTNQQYAVLRYTQSITDTTKFSPLFTVTLSHLLAGMLAGPLLKGDIGIQVAEQQYKLSAVFQAQAEGSDANQRRVRPVQGAPWMVRR